MTENVLGDFLRARRARVTPEAAGFRTVGQRRVPGLRHEEVATQAGMNVDYYVRLEQGRERRPSAQVLDALAQALLLDEDARMHLFHLAGVAPSGPGAPRTTPPDEVAPELRQLLGMWSDNPAIVLGRGYDLLAGNALAYALFEGFQQGPNLVMKIFLDPGARAFYPDWEHVARYTVAGLRILYGEDPHEPRINEVIDTMLTRSADFARMWEHHEARRKRMESKRFCHPDVGEMTLWMNAFDVKSSPGQELVVYHARPDTASADALALLGTLAATRVPTARCRGRLTTTSPRRRPQCSSAAASTASMAPPRR